MNKLAKFTLLVTGCIAAVGFTAIPVAQAQIINFNNYGCSVWIPDRFQNWNNTLSSKSFRYNNSSIEITVANNNGSADSLRRDKANDAMRFSRYQLQQDNTFVVDDGHRASYVELTTSQVGRRMLEGYFYVELANGRILTLNTTMPDDDYGHASQEFYRMCRGFECYNHYGNNNNDYQNRSYNNGGYQSHSYTAADYYNKGVDLGKAGRTREAIEYYDKAISVNPNYYNAYYNRGNAYKKLKNYDLAIASYTYALDIKSDFTYAFNNRGSCYFSLEEYENALEDFQNAQRTDPNFSLAYDNLGKTYYELKNYDKAISNFQAYLTRNPNKKETMKFISICYRKAGNYSVALETANKLIYAHPNYANGYQQRALAYEGLGENDKAANDYATAKRYGYKVDEDE